MIGFTLAAGLGCPSPACARPGDRWKPTCPTRSPFRASWRRRSSACCCSSARSVGSWLALAVWIYACITDFLDGYLARSLAAAVELRSHARSDRRQAAGRLGAAGAGRRRPAGRAHRSCRRRSSSAAKSWSRACASSWRSCRCSVPVTRLAKWKTTIQMVAIGFLVVGDAGPRVGPVGPVEIGLVRAVGGRSAHPGHRLRLSACWAASRRRRPRPAERPFLATPPIEPADAHDAR